ncbi:response regulator [Nesterenkonia alkaliphila]|uniref:Response regulator n=1 Tax=Nesterenkonia alkaliphila TaxID=1463631 RepID=A0A7K1UE80_9MICC|nr:response regulator transcription factor [Nesterenkonia alkaliphila]MVT24785.1 response regulator [Nesterenkonia alkaliphila]GFZ95923.1 DNA-binding response regulator [Nesterenkonia alkaliphila]
MTGQGSGDRVQVMVVDDQTLVRQGIRTLLELGGITVVAEAGDGAEALAVLREAEPAPDVVLLDLRMPQYDGLWLLRKLQEADCEIPVLVLTTFDDDTLVLDALRAGARGYLLKDVTVEQLSAAVQTLAEGGTLIAPSITDRLLRAIKASPEPAGARGVVVEQLTDRETEVLRLVAEGYSNRQIAGLVHLAEGTVKNHISSILIKLGARDRTNAVLRAIREGMLG